MNKDRTGGPAFHDWSREKEVQLLCDCILDSGVEFYDNPNGPYEWSCPYCTGKITGGYEQAQKGVRIEEIKHQINCEYLIAKDLKQREEPHE